jgi:hypothetical protein
MQFDQQKQLGRKIVHMVYVAKNGIPVKTITELFNSYSEIVILCKLNELRDNQIIDLVQTDTDVLAVYKPVGERI